MNKVFLSKIPYHFIGVTSEDELHPLISLISEETNEGWISKKFCEYPQEILIKFNQPIRLRRVNIIFHQTKIPSKVELYQFFPRNFNDFFIDIHSIIFDKIGFVSPDSLFKTDYNVREFKTINLNENVYILKIVFNKCIYNIHNPFNQVGLAGLEFLGYEFTKDNINLLFPNREKEIELHIDNLDYYIPSPKILDKEYDELCKNKIYIIKEQLNELIKREYFDNAKKLSEILYRVRFLGGKINDLNYIKKKAVEVEDYEKAGIMKKEIEKLRDIVEKVNVNIFPNIPYNNLNPNINKNEMYHYMENPEVDIKKGNSNLKENKEFEGQNII